jgi:hypothetical protein
LQRRDLGVANHETGHAPIVPGLASRLFDVVTGGRTR